MLTINQKTYTAEIKYVSVDFQFLSMLIGFFKTLMSTVYLRKILGALCADTGECNSPKWGVIFVLHTHVKLAKTKIDKVLHKESCSNFYSLLRTC
jgi:hypothetical protein